MFLVFILLRQCWYLDCWFYLIFLILWWKVLMVPLKVPLIYRKYILCLFFLPSVSMPSMSMEVILDTASLSLELVLLFEMLSLTTKSIRWLLSGILSGMFEILLLSSVMVFRSTASICSVGKPLTFSGVLFFGMSEFSLMSSFPFGVPAKMVFALFLLNLKQHFQMVCSLLPRFDLSFVKTQHYCVQLMTVLFYFSFCFLL